MEVDVYQFPAWPLIKQEDFLALVPSCLHPTWPTRQHRGVPFPQRLRGPQGADFTLLPACLRLDRNRPGLRAEDAAQVTVQGATESPRI